MRILLAISLLFLAINPTQAQTAESIVELQWEGWSEFPSDLTQSGYVVLTNVLTVDLYEDNRVYGRMRTGFNLDGVQYYATSTVSGTFYPSSWQLSITYDQFTQQDTLPYDMYWCLGNADLTFYKDSGNPGHYILRGTVWSCGNSLTIEMYDR